ncbi:probable fucosyltransferase 9 [Impatiens glandulifera]|uniref:probable fucosyltransferase 9 n=1 Tax=Impatiens glandulifera TaxID=253017 RepID=UPI001FB06A99|nr:probable fucosyltransferase 9 [Impatiens glandulifera]
MKWRWIIGLASSFLLVCFMYNELSAVSDIGAGLAATILLRLTSHQNPRSDQLHKDRLLGGLLEELGSNHVSSCISKRESVLYRKTSPYKPSSYLVSRLRKYESMHRNCGPGTKPFEESLKLLSQLNMSHDHDHDQCKYLVWLPSNGLGNRLVSIVSTFLYALLTDRILLIDESKNIEDLLCEPFENATWLLPPDFPLKNSFRNFRRGYPHSYGNRIMKNATNSIIHLPFMYLHLLFDYSEHDKLFYCDEYQIPLQEIPWLVLRSDEYFAPSLFLMPGYDQELERLFPKKDTVFHHLGRYLFHPSNDVWGLVKRYYNTYLAKADERIGIQIRDFKTTPMAFKWMKKQIFSYYLPHFTKDESTTSHIRDICSVASLEKHMLDRVISCTFDRQILPKLRKTNNDTIPSGRGKRGSMAILTTSLSLSYYDNIRNMCWEHQTETGEVIGVYQPSHEDSQQSEEMTHNMKAWAEIYLLSLMDVLITSPFSTFGYVAQGLGGMQSWIINSPYREIESSEPSCILGKSMEPCFHSPPYFDCKAKTGANAGLISPYVQHCEDLKWGIKLVDDHI